MGLVLDELEENEKDVIKENGVNIVFDPRLKNYINTRSGLTIDFRRDRYGEGFMVLGGSTC